MILECVPLKISDLIFPDVNFGGQIHTKLYPDFKWSPASGRWDWSD